MIGDMARFNGVIAGILNKFLASALCQSYPKVPVSSGSQGEGGSFSSIRGFRRFLTTFGDFLFIGSLGLRELRKLAVIHCRLRAGPNLYQSGLPLQLTALAHSSLKSLNDNRFKILTNRCLLAHFLGDCPPLTERDHFPIEGRHTGGSGYAIKFELAQVSQQARAQKMQISHCFLTAFQFRRRSGDLDTTLRVLELEREYYPSYQIL